MSQEEFGPYTGDPAVVAELNKLTGLIEKTTCLVIRSSDREGLTRAAEHLAERRSKEFHGISKWDATSRGMQLADTDIAANILIKLASPGDVLFLPWGEEIPKKTWDVLRPLIMYGERHPRFEGKFGILWKRLEIASVVTVIIVVPDFRYIPDELQRHDNVTLLEVSVPETESARSVSTCISSLPE